MQIKNVKDKSKVYIVIQSRVHDKDVSGSLGKLGEFEKLELPTTYFGKPSKCKWSSNYTILDTKL